MAETGWRRLAAYAGMIGPVWLGGTIAVLSVLEYEFMRSLQWHPLESPTTDWPSGLALGPLGAWMTLAFVGCGLLMVLFAWGLATTLRRVVGPLLLALAGVALAALGFTTDPTYLPTPRTWHGGLHDLAFMLLGASLFPAMIALSIAFWRAAGWRGYAVYTLVTLLLAAPAFVIKGAAFYGFLGAMMLWFVVLALRLWRDQNYTTAEPRN